MTDQEFADACSFSLGYVKGRTPYRTGNLVKHGDQLSQFKTIGTIYVDMNNAPYMPYTNEPWIAHRWGGKKNPNESWWNKTAEALVYEIADFIGGEVIQ